MTLCTWINRLRLSSVEQREPCLFLSGLLGYTPADWTLYEQALTHRSASRSCNERLEFLGDAVIGLVVTDVLYRLYPEQREGILTRYRSHLVCRERLNCIAQRIGLDKYLQIGTPLKKNAEDVYGNALEALVGAVYRDCGYKRAEAFVLQYIIGKENVLRHELEDKDTDYKSALLEWGQHHQKKVVFTMLKERYDVKSDMHMFVVQAEVDGMRVQGGGYTKREAQHTAARKMLNELRKR